MADRSQWDRVALTPEEKRARKLAEQHRQDGGKELFDE